MKVYADKIEFYNLGRLPENITISDLLTNRYKSTPRNKQIADFCKDLGLIEKYSSGIQRVIGYFLNENLPIPLFENISDGFMVTVFADEKAKMENGVVDIRKKTNVVENVVEDVVENEACILKMIEVNNRISANELAGELNLSGRTIQRYLKSLQNKLLLRRVGSAKGGYWECIKR